MLTFSNSFSSCLVSILPTFYQCLHSSSYRSSERAGSAEKGEAQKSEAHSQWRPTVCGGLQRVEAAEEEKTRETKSHGRAAKVERQSNPKEHCKYRECQSPEGMAREEKAKVQREHKLAMMKQHFYYS